MCLLYTIGLAFLSIRRIETHILIYNIQACQTAGLRMSVSNFIHIYVPYVQRTIHTYYIIYIICLCMAYCFPLVHQYWYFYFCFRYVHIAGLEDTEGIQLFTKIIRRFSG